ncbi:MAG: hypothetical protein JWQ71_3157 [Pedosphaera sp.]|nr:hypothetical protein [Pedosphaera sp.]
MWEVGFACEEATGEETARQQFPIQCCLKGSSIEYAYSLKVGAKGQFYNAGRNDCLEENIFQWSQYSQWSIRRNRDGMLKRFK